MCPYDARNALSVANLTPIDYRGGPLLQAVQNIEDGARNRRVLRLMFNVCDKSVVHWFERAICVEHTQNAMFDAAPPTWGRYLPAYGAMRVLMDAAFTPGFDEIGALVVSLLWLSVLTALAAFVFRRVMTR